MATSRHFCIAAHLSGSAKSEAGEALHAGGGGGKECAASSRAEQRLAPEGPQAPITRKAMWRAALPLTRNSCGAFQAVRANAWAAVSAICRPIARELVAPGLGSLRT